jgi:hypothetical protein
MYTAYMDPVSVVTRAVETPTKVRVSPIFPDVWTALKPASKGWFTWDKATTTVESTASEDWSPEALLTRAHADHNNTRNETSRPSWGRNTRWVAAVEAASKLLPYMFDAHADVLSCICKEVEQLEDLKVVIAVALLRYLTTNPPPTTITYLYIIPTSPPTAVVEWR